MLYLGIDTDIEHPEITLYRLTGYGYYNQPKSHCCQECGKRLDDEAIYEDEHREYLCKNCLLYFHEKDW